jgi:hypothetical protein
MPTKVINSSENMLSFSENVCKRAEEKGKGSTVEREESPDGDCNPIAGFFKGAMNSQ